MLRRTWSFVIGATLVLATPGVVLAQAVEAGPIWNQADAQNKCPAVCQPGQWSGQWWTTRPGQMSVCQCSRPQPPPVVAPPPVMAPPVMAPPGRHFGGPSMLTLGNGKCLDINGGQANNNGATVQVWDCHGGINQQWRWERGALVSGTNKCLSMRPDQVGQSGGRVTIWDCTGGPNQQWRREGAMLINEAGKCLAANPGMMNQNGGPITVWDCRGGANQQWSRQPLAAPPPPQWR